jgi:molybdate transport system ATP-binding protein
MRLRVENLRLSQGAFQLKIDVDTTGGVIGVFGNSGAGKTSLLEAVAGLRRPALGRIEIDDLMLMDRAKGVFLAPEVRGVGYVPQDLALFPHFSVKRNVTYGRRGREVAPGISLEHVVEVLEIGELLGRAVAQLSGGQKQRVAFARALLAQPRLLLMDEPLASLDQELKWKIVPYLQRIRDEFRIPMLYVSHSPEEVMALCDQVLVLHAGECLRVRPPGELFEERKSVGVRAGILP